MEEENKKELGELEGLEVKAMEYLAGESLDAIDALLEGLDTPPPEPPKIPTTRPSPPPDDEDDFYSRFEKS